jgi:hypothetical protein
VICELHVQNNRKQSNRKQSKAGEWCTFEWRKRAFLLVLALYGEGTQVSTEVLTTYQLVIECFLKPVDILPIWYISFQESE